MSCHRAKLLSVLLHYAPTGYIFMFRLRSCTRVERSYTSRRGIAAFSSCPVMQNHSRLHMSTSRCASGCIELPSCQIAVGSAALCPYGEHIHVQIEVLHTRRTLLHLATRRCCVVMPCCNDITRCSSAVQARTFDFSSSSTQVIRISARVVDIG